MNLGYQSLNNVEQCVVQSLVQTAKHKLTQSLNKCKRGTAQYRVHKRSQNTYWILLVMGKPMLVAVLEPSALGRVESGPFKRNLPPS